MNTGILVISSSSDKAEYKLSWKVTYQCGNKHKKQTRSYSALLGTWIGSSGLQHCWPCRDTVQRLCTGRTLASERRRERHCAPPLSRLHSTETHRQTWDQILYTLHTFILTIIFPVHLQATLIRNPVYSFIQLSNQSVRKMQFLLLARLECGVRVVPDSLLGSACCKFWCFSAHHSRKGWLFKLP